MILLDTNVLARMTDSANRDCALARRAVYAIEREHEKLFVVPQNLYEFWAVATRKPGRPPSGQNGLGMGTERASQWLRFFRRRFAVMPDHEDLLERWHDLVRTLGITGLHSHDARLVAAMQTLNVNRLLTFNADHFVRFPITVVDPASLQGR